MPIKKISANRASYQSHSLNQSLTKPDTIQRVTAVNNNVIDTATVVDDNQHKAYLLRLKKVDNALERQRRRCRKIVEKSNGDTLAQIIDFVMNYNQIIYLIIQVEQLQDRQIDQTVQHYLMANGSLIRMIGLDTRQSIYLEYNKIKIKDYLSQFDKRQVWRTLFARDGLFSKLLTTIDQLVSKLHDKPDETPTQNIHLDIRA